MFNKLTLAAGFGAGYVLGAKAGKERYFQIEAKFRELAGMPAVQRATATVKETAADLADSAKATVSNTLASAKDNAGPAVTPATIIDLASTPTGAPTAARTTSTTTSPVTASPVPASPVTTGSTAPRPMTPGAGAAPSVTAPVI